MTTTATISTQAELDAAAPGILSAPCGRCKDVEHNYPPEVQAAVFAGCRDCGGTGVPCERVVRLTPTEPLDLSRWLGYWCCGENRGQDEQCPDCGDTNGEHLPHIARVTVSGQVGPDAKPLNPAWVRAIRDQCAAAGVEFVFGGWGEWMPIPSDSELLGWDTDYWTGATYVEAAHIDGVTYTDVECDPDSEDWCFARVGPEASGRTLDGREWPGP